jgi:FMN-dependent NADH-azoreductase
MRNLLHVMASPRRERSYSTIVAESFIQAYREKHPDVEVDEQDLFREALPPFDGAALDAKYKILHGNDVSSDEAEAWAAVEAVVGRFMKADLYVFSVPMWNFGIPYRLKHYFDLLIQPGYTFSFSPDTGYTGLVGGKKAVAVYTRGGTYAPGSETGALDHQKPYMELVLGFMGITDVQSVVVEPTLMGGPEMAAEKRQRAVQAARELGSSF